MRRRAEAVVGEVGGDPDAAREPRVEQDQRERSLSSPSAAQSNSTSVNSSASSSRDDAVPGAQAYVGVDDEGEAGCEA